MAKTVEQELGDGIIRFDPDEEDYDNFKVINKISRHIEQSTIKTVINKTSKRLLGLNLKSDNVRK